MHAMTDHSGVDQARQGNRWRFYRAVWRWHFYAGLLVLPFIIWLAVTGAAFLYQDAIDRSVHHDLKVVPVGHARVPAQQLVAAAQQRYAGRLFVYTTPKQVDASAEIGLVDAHGVRQVVYVDPYRARVLGALAGARYAELDDPPAAQPGVGRAVCAWPDRNGGRLGDRAGAYRCVSVVAARATWRRDQCAWQAEAAAVLARPACGDRCRGWRDPAIACADRYAVVMALGCTGQSLGQWA